MGFDQKEYNRNYMKEKRRKKNTKVFKVDLPCKEFDELEELLKKNNFKTKASFLRYSIKKILKEEK